MENDFNYFKLDETKVDVEEEAKKTDLPQLARM